MGHRITLKDIADDLSISIGTVDRAIHNRGRINSITQARIMSRIEEMGYKTNTLARTLRKNQASKITLIAPTYNYFFQDIARGVSESFAELAGFPLVLDIIAQDSENDPIKQLRDFDKALESEPGGIILVPLHPFLLRGSINKAVERSIPVVTMNLDSADSKRICHVGQDSYHTGGIIGHLFGKFLRGRGRVAILTGISDLFSWQHRTEGFLGTLSKYYPQIEVAEINPFSNDAQIAYEISKILLLSDPSLTGLFANTTAGTIGIGLAIRDFNKCEQVVTVCYDTQNEVMDLLDVNAAIATVTQNPYMQGYYAAKIMGRILLESSPPKDEFYYVRADVILNREHYNLNTRMVIDP